MVRTFCVGAVLALALCSTAVAQTAGISEDRPWQWRTEQERVAKTAIANAVALNKAGYYDQFRNGANGGANGGSSGTGGLFGSSASATNNYFQFVDQSSVTCTASGVGSVVSCTGSTNNVTNGQTATDNTNTATSDVNGNNFHVHDNTVTGK